MGKENTQLTVCLTLLLIPVIFSMFVPFALAQPAADSIGVDNASGYKNTTVSVPVTISNTQNGPVTCIIFDVSYDNNVINIVEVKKGTITTSWKSPTYCNFDWGTKVSIAYTGRDVEAIPNGMSGIIALLKFSVVGEPGETTEICVNNLQLSDLSGENVGFDTAPATDGTFTIVTNRTQTPSSNGSPSPTVSPTESLTVSPVAGSEGVGEAITPDATESVIPTATPTMTPSVLPATASPVKVSPSSLSSPSSAPTAMSTATPSPPGFDAIFAIAGVFAVAYLVLRRKKAQP
ncbi:Cohesin domain-containing protein [Candidatus Methanophagaceae archaeon]|nr:Cohesin domain-containing protein [Methanophagales archaeon]